ncbi:sensor histidine kinase [Streptomyces sp. NBC_00658]|uniref:sensor histidine kinase n=1 Tax=Streptomyces sp. NBC_00658 TaxID=2975800 RepID=UPI003867E3D9
MEHVLTTREHLGRRGKRLARPARRDWLLAVGTGLASIPLTFVAQGDNAHTPDVLGWTLFGLSALTLAWRRHYPMGALLVLIVVEGTYHVLGNAHSGLIAVTIVAIYSLAVAGPRRRTLAVVPTLLGLSVIMLTSINPERGIELLRISGWILACAITGEAVRVHRNYIGAVVERAERAERTREEEARRRVAEERLRIARDLHDLLAHTITLIGVQTSVAAHVLAADPDRLDREAVAKALDDISGTCRSARGELRATLEVLRESQYGGDRRGPLPGLDGVPDLAKAARLSGAEVELTVHADDVPPAVGAAAYRIVQEALTNAVRHGGPGVPVRVDLRAEGGTLRVAVTDEGAGDTGGTTPGFGLVGMRERARSVGGTVEAGVRLEGGFEVVAVLPLGGAVAALPAQNSVREAEAVHESAAVRESDVVREAEPVRAVEAVREAEFDRGELR